MAKKILVADDNASFRNSLKEVLEHSGYEVICVSDGDECLKNVILDNPDLLLLDILMPGMDGYVLLSAFQRLNSLAGGEARMPVIIITGKDISADKTVKNISLMTYENVKAYFTKPYDIEELLAEIKKILG
jgi:CheY-like chemotaxis protein